MDDSRRAAKEAWVTGHSGGSMLEVAVVSAVSVAGHFAYQSLRLTRTWDSAFGRDLRLQLAAEYFLLVLPSVVATSFASLASSIVAFLFILALVLLYSSPAPPNAARTAPPHPFSASPALPPVLAYRSTMMLLTCASILAVDFPSFPRRFAKCEDAGTSLMDMGVGSFVFSNGLVAGRPRSAEGRPRRAGSWRSSLPVFGLGVLRALSTRGVNYQTHSSEYGTHWNFFATLGMVAIGAGLAKDWEAGLVGRSGRSGMPVGTWTAVGLAITLAHQLALTHLGLQHWVTTAPRATLLSANKEGLASVPGYLALYFCALDAGRFALAPPGKGGWWGTVRGMGGWAAGLWALFYVANGAAGIEVSRKLANSSYVLWVAAYNVTFLAVYYSVDLVIAGRLMRRKGAVKDAEAFPESHLLGAVSRNQLGVFLFANVLTGLVNLSIDTLACSVPLSFAIVAAYMLVVSGAAVALDKRGLRLRFW
ncbi:GWT1-domain-containing protein [Hyaloraphidium curvatum]|nr:GWT1-domain-containing protein [Hyaloraphidium curvatum]